MAFQWRQCYAKVTSRLAQYLLFSAVNRCDMQICQFVNDRTSFSLGLTEKEHLSVLRIHPVLLVTIAASHKKHALTLSCRDDGHLCLTNVWAASHLSASKSGAIIFWLLFEIICCLMRYWGRCRNTHHHLKHSLIIIIIALVDVNVLLNCSVLKLLALDYIAERGGVLWVALKVGLKRLLRLYLLLVITLLKLFTVCREELKIFGERFLDFPFVSIYWVRRRLLATCGHHFK